MAFVVEDGTGLSNANSLASVSDYDTYYTDRGNSDALSVDNKEAILVQASDYLRTMYDWDSTPLNSTQSLPFPRSDYGLPEQIKEATIILALKASEKSLISDEERRVVKEKVSSLEVTYDQNDTQVGMRYTAVEALVRPYLKSHYSSFQRKAIR